MNTNIKRINAKREDLKLTVCTDANILQNLDKRIFSYAWNLASWQSFLCQPFNVSYLFCLEKNFADVVGFLSISQNEDFYEIIRVGVLPQWRKKKIAFVALSIWMKELTKDKRILLEVSIQNKAAFLLYRKLGFQTIDIRKNYYHDSDACVMQLHRQ